MELLISFGLGGLGGIVVSGVAIAWFLHREPQQTDVDELAIEVERLSKAYRRERMQRVRSYAGDPEQPVPAVLGPGGNSVEETKASLRARVFGGRTAAAAPIDYPKRGTP